MREHDAILLGAVGWPGVPDHVSLWGLLIPIRRGFDQYASVRPCKLMPGARTPLAGRTEADIDFVVVRENTEASIPPWAAGCIRAPSMSSPASRACSAARASTASCATRSSLRRPEPRKKLTSATKSNGITITMPYWDERFAAMKAHYPDVETDQFHIDILCAHFVQHPDWFDVVVGSNLFGDILSDLGPAVAGSIGIAPSANINPERLHPSMFEPVHGSAPDIAGKGIANPIGQIWSAAQMLEHLGERRRPRAIVDSFEALLREGGPRNPRHGRPGRDDDVGRAIAEAVRSGR